MNYDEEIKLLEDQLLKTQYNKATEHHFGVVRARIAQLRNTKEKRQSIGKSTAGWSVRKSGDATVVLLGFPSVGKSTLLNALTGAKSKTAAYAFTTLTAIPGVMFYNNAKIQIIDVPGIVAGAASGKGRGREVLGMVRSSDLILILIDSEHPEHYDAVLKEAYDAGIRLNKKEPIIKIAKREKGGLDIQTTVKLTHVSVETIAAICREYRINSAGIVIRSDITIDDFIDVLEGSRKYIPSLTIGVKSDLLTPEARKSFIKLIKPDLMVSAQTNENISELKDKIFEGLQFIRLYLKEVNKKADMDVPLILRRGATILDVCKNIHRDMAKKFKFARIWGKSAKFPGQQIQKPEKVLADGDVIEIHAR